MPPESIAEIKSRFFACGYLPPVASPDLTQKIRNYGAEMQIRDLESQGLFFFTTPFYTDVAEDGEMVWVKLGLAHDSAKRLSTEEMVEKGWLNRDGVKTGSIRGSVTLVGFSKREKRCFVYRNLLSPAGLVYKVIGDALLLTDNLRVITYLLGGATPNEEEILQHHISRQVYGRNTYVKGVNKLLGGEEIRLSRDGFNLSLMQDFRGFEEQADKKPVNAETVAWFFEKLSAAVGYRIDGNESQSATLLSGGIDSSTMQAAINTRPGIDSGFPSYSFAVNAPGFQFEVEYAKEASRLLHTNHTFLDVDPEKFPDWLVSSISILGMPVNFDAPPSYFAIAKFIKDNDPQIRYLFNGANADVLTGNYSTMDLIQGDKYRNWPIWLLQLMAAVLKPVSPSKSHGARTAAEVLTNLEDVYSIENPFNRSSTCDWELVMKCFPREEVHNFFKERRQNLSNYSSSEYLCEQRQLMNLTLDGMTTPGLERQLGLYCGREMWFPFSDDSLVEAVLSFEPIDRYSHDHRVKPLMRMALESQAPSSVTQKQKGHSSAFDQAIAPWMRDGSLRPLVQEIDRPGYISQPDFQKVIDDPGWFTWNLLTMDLFKKHGF